MRNPVETSGFNNLNFSSITSIGSLGKFFCINLKKYWEDCQDSRIISFEMVCVIHDDGQVWAIIPTFFFSKTIYYSNCTETIVYSIKQNWKKSILKRMHFCY